MPASNEPTTSVRDFVTQAYQLISASTPTVPLQGSDLSIGISVLNRLLNQYSANGLMITIEQQVDYALSIGQQFVTIGQPDVTPTPDIDAPGRLVALENAWVTLQGITYPLIYEKRTQFYSAYKYEPLMGLPRYIVMVPQNNLTTVQVFPSPSQEYALSIYGKFQPSVLTADTDMSSLPTYYQMFLQFALARYLAAFKGRMEAWTPQLEAMFRDLEVDTVGVTPVNLDINVNQESWLNGAWRVRAGI